MNAAVLRCGPEVHSAIHLSVQIPVFCGNAKGIIILPNEQLSVSHIHGAVQTNSHIYSMFMFADLRLMLCTVLNSPVFNFIALFYIEEFGVILTQLQLRAVM